MSAAPTILALGVVDARGVFSTIHLLIQTQICQLLHLMLMTKRIDDQL